MQLQLQQKKMEDLYSLFNLERILLASFLMSAIKSSSSALVSGRRREISGSTLVCRSTSPTYTNFCKLSSIRDRINTDTQNDSKRHSQQDQILYQLHYKAAHLALLHNLHFVVASLISSSIIFFPTTVHSFKQHTVQYIWMYRLFIYILDSVRHQPYLTFSPQQKHNNLGLNREQEEKKAVWHLHTLPWSINYQFQHTAIK